MRRSFFPLYFTNFFGVVNDNFLKTLAGFIVIGWIDDPRMKPVYMGITAGALVLPYILCSPLADRLTAVFLKRRIVTLAKWAELPIVAIGIVGFMTHSATLVVGAVLLMGFQSSFYSPAKYALVRDIGGADRISTGMGGMEGVTFLGVLAGTIAASVAVDRYPEWVQYVGLASFATIGLAGSFTIRADEEMSRQLHSVNPLRYLKRAYRIAKGYPGLNSVILTLSVFWFAAAMLQMGLLIYGKEVMGLDETHTGALLCTAAVGIVAGQVSGGFIDKRHFLLGVSLVTGWGAAALLLALFVVPMNAVGFAVVLGFLAFDLGLFKLPFDAEIQKVAKGPKLNTMLAYFNMVSFFFMLMASGCYALLSWCFGPGAFLLFLGLLMLVAPVVFVLTYRKVLVYVGRWIFRRRYDVTIDGMESFRSQPSASTSYLVLPNHPAMVDPMIVTAELWQTPLKPLSDEAFFRTGLVAPLVLRTLGAVAVPDLRKHRSATSASVARGLGKVVLDALRDGGNVIFYPSGHIQTERDVESIGTRQLAYNICRELPVGTRVIGVRTRGLWGSIWSRAGRDSSPKFVPTLVKSVLLWFLVSPFKPKRKVGVHIEDLTDRVREWSTLTRLEFNRKLEEWYNI